MRFLLIFSILAAFLGGCSSSYDPQREEQQESDTFDRPVGSEEAFMSPYEHHPR